MSKKYGIKFTKPATCYLTLTGMPVGMQIIFKDLIAMANTIEKWLYITSLNDRKHSQNSLHYKNLAVDVRVWNLTKDDRFFICESFDYYDHFDAIDEGDHLHIEWDPDYKEADHVG